MEKIQIQLKKDECQQMNDMHELSEDQKSILQNVIKKNFLRLKKKGWVKLP